MKARQAGVENEGVSYKPRAQKIGKSKRLMLRQEERLRQLANTKQSHNDTVPWRNTPMNTGKLSSSAWHARRG